MRLQSTGHTKSKDTSRKQEKERKLSGHQVIVSVRMEAVLDVVVLELHPVGFEDEEDEGNHPAEWQQSRSVDYVGPDPRNCRGRSRVFNCSILYSFNSNYPTPFTPSTPTTMYIFYSLFTFYSLFSITSTPSTPVPYPLPGQLQVTTNVGSSVGPHQSLVWEHSKK